MCLVCHKTVDGSGQLGYRWLSARKKRPSAHGSSALSNNDSRISGEVDRLVVGAVTWPHRLFSLLSVTDENKLVPEHRFAT